MSRRQVPEKKAPIIERKPIIEKPIKSSIDEILPTRYRLKCKNEIQKTFANLISEKEIIVAAGPAGVGKSYVAVARAIELLQNKSNPYKYITISTPAEEAGEDLGYLPGTLRDKMEPYLASTLDIFDKIIGKTKRLELEEAEILKFEPLGFIRGKSIDDTILLMEEAQNMSVKQMKTLLTRIGENSKFIISGDLDQSDRFADAKKTGLYDVVNRHRNVEEIGFVQFDEKDVVRNPLIRKILDNYKLDNVKIDTIKVDPVKPQKPEIKLIMEGELPKKSNESVLEYQTRVENKFFSWIRKNFRW